ncbi:hypothetical protein KJ586_04045 [Patescibacteria group bacterium]|nr:hypothetical protein [Patescibacteria group bacterium]MBU4455652.1 hypothetical protein [Patescibacteria group bacterium]
MPTKIKVKKINPPAGGRKSAKPGKAVLIKKQSKKLEPEEAPAPEPKEATKAEIVLKSISQEEKAPDAQNELSAIKNLEVNKIINIKEPQVDKVNAVDKELAEKTAGKDRSIAVYRKIAYSFIILTVMLLAAIFYFSFVKVTITILPKQEAINSNLIVDILDKDKGTAAGGAVTGEVKQAEIEQSKTYAGSGIETVGEEVKGKIIVFNNYNRSQQLVATTRFLSPDNKLFRLKNTITVPAGGRVEADVYADEVNPEMAIAAAHFIIPGLWAGLQDKIYGESKEPMEYSRKVKRYIQQADIETAVKDLRESLLEKAKVEIGENYKDYSRVIYDIDNNSISREVGGKVGEEKDEFPVTMKTNVIVVAFNEDDIFKLAQQKLNSILSDDKKLAEFGKDNISYGLNGYNINQGSASLNASFSGKITAREGADIVERDKILGLSREQLDVYLKNMPEIADYEIKFYPSFINKVPNLADRIEIEIKNNF